MLRICDEHFRHWDFFLNCTNAANKNIKKYKERIRVPKEKIRFGTGSPKSGNIGQDCGWLKIENRGPIVVSQN